MLFIVDTSGEIKSVSPTTVAAVAEGKPPKPIDYDRIAIDIGKSTLEYTCQRIESINRQVYCDTVGVKRSPYHQPRLGIVTIHKIIE